jgi:gliding motility-associated-like protein
MKRLDVAMKAGGLRYGLVLLSLAWWAAASAQVYPALNGATYDDCSGVFVDSGGPAGPYSNSESITTTICPTGGAGAGPSTAVLFTVWDLAPGAGDQLAIHPGVDASQPALIVAGSATPMVGQSFVSTHPSGCLTFVWTSDVAGTAEGWVAQIITGPDAGENASATVCSSNPPFALFDLLGGSPDPGGVWTDPNSDPHSGTFIPGTDLPGVYTYVVGGPVPCPSAAATVSITVNPARNAGISETATVCSNVVPFSMRQRLGGSPESGGTWTDPFGQAHSSTFEPANDIPGAYTYTLTGQAPCPNASAVLTVALVTAPSAGTGTSLSLCSDGITFDLFTALGGLPQAGGTWSGPDGASTGLFFPASDTPGDYVYTVLGDTPCANATATVTVTVEQRPDAGSSATTTVCSNAAPFSLFAILGGTPDPGGAWTGPGGNSVSGTFTPGVSVPGIYTYTVLGNPPCAASVATVTVNQVAAPNAGSNASFMVCSNEAPFDLVDRLGGTPQPGGTWSGPNGPHGPTFDPATDGPGAYVYTVLGNAPCANASATLSIALQQAPDAGNNSTITVCSTDGSFQLLTALAGTPDAGGSWVGPDAQPASGTFTPGISLPGSYTYTVVGLSPCLPATASLTVSVNTAPVAGVNASVSRCSDDAPFNLFALLGGTPNVGGSWVGPNGAHGDVFTPGIDLPGAYIYTVAGLAPCADATAVVTVSISQAPKAGSDASSTVCSADAPISLFALLGGAPDVNGTWTGPGGSPHGGTFFPSTDTPGVYTYTVEGQGPCSDDEATVTMTVVNAPDAGANGNLTVCSDAAPVDLFTLLGGTPDLGGAWTRPSGASHSGTYLPNVEPGGTYTYTVQGVIPCTNASASVQVVRIVAPNAGVNGNTTVCSTNGPFPMLSLLGGNPNGNGSWFNALGNSVSGTFTPGTTTPGVFSYVVEGTSPCLNDTAQLTIAVNQAPSAGSNASITVCSNQGAIELLNVLNGTPDLTGSWTDPNGIGTNGAFTPGTSLPGGYTYLVPGQTPCLDASAVVVVSENRQPVAGNSAAFERCSTDGPVDLFSLLGGTPDAGGTWTGPSGPMSGIFLPGISEPGPYAYSLSALAPCVAVQATVTATVNQAPNAGVSGSISVCADQPVVDLFEGLGGTPDPGGVWNDVGQTGQQSGQFFNPTGLPAGNYTFTYTVLGSGQCGDVTSTVIVDLVGLLDAGTNGTLSVCRTNTQVNLFAGLGGTPQQGGQWIDLDGTGALTNQFFNASQVPAGTYLFRYLLSGTVSCASDSALVTVTAVAGPNAGTNGQAITCSNSPPFSLFPFLGGNPQNGGTWTRDGLPFSGVFNPLLDNSGVFVYTVSGSAPCANATATVTVNEVTAPNAGTSATISVCSNGGTFNMTQQLGGSPQPGSWSFGGQPHGNLFVPGLDQPGIYVYTVTGSAPCNPAQSTLTISVVPAPDAGNNASRTVCSNSLPFALNPLLGSNAQPGGTWVGPNNIPSDGIFIPGTSEPGDYFYTVTGLVPCVPDVAVVSVFVNQAPNAGNSAAVTLCAGGAGVNLLSVLGGTPDPTGSWTGPAPDTTPFGGVFVPGTSVPGVYTYTVLGAPPCSTVSATVTVAVNAQPNAGCSNALTVCSNAIGFAMIDRLLCSPAPGGVWTGPAPGNPPSSGVFIPGVTLPGVYTYTVPGVAPCQNSTSTLSIGVNQAANAGNDASITLCNTGGAVNLFPLLGPNAQVGGTWTAPNESVHSGTFLPGVDASGTYRYTVPGLSPCASDFALVTVVVNQAPSAGCNGLITVCNSNLPVPLFDLLGCSPQPTGNWRNPSGAPHSGIFVPGVDLPGVYTYTVNGTAPCSNSVAQVTVIVNQAPNAGQDAFLALCSDQAPTSLFNALGGNPGPGGSWTDPGGDPFSGTYVPGVSTPGIYRYRLTALAPCQNDTSQVTVTENVAPDAGFSNVALVCSNTLPFPLTDLLGGTPDLTGTWTLGGQAHGPVFNPAVDGSGTYVYTVTGIAPCSDAIAQVQLTRVTAPNAGVGGTIAACVDDPAIPLVLGLTGPYNAGGTWTENSGTGQLSGAVFNATGLPQGLYSFTYTVVGFSPCSSASTNVTVSITEALYAGEDALISACENEIVDLFDAIGGDPQVGGFWQDVDGSGALIGGVFNAGLVNDGTTWRFRYVLGASAQCPSDTALVTVSVVDGPFAGCDGALSLCTVNAPTQLINALTCGPDADGIWINPLGAPHNGTFLPAADVPGVYLYVVPGAGSCASDTARVNVQVTQAVNAGNDASISFCATDGPTPLFPLLGPDAQPNGSWTFGGAQHPGVYDPALHSPGVYRYRLVGQPPCSNDDAFVTVSEFAAPNAGCNAAVNLCSSQAPINMRLSLGCGAAAGGTWEGPNGPHGTFFDPASDVPGSYVYTVTGQAPCANATATLVVAVTNASNAGQNASLSACVGQTAVDLFQALGPLAQPNGSWTDVSGSGALAGNIFNPSLAGIGLWTFIYGFPSNGPCGAVSRQVVVNVVAGSSAGADSSVTVCGANTAFSLFNALGGIPSVGGTWTDQLGTGALLPNGILNASLLPPGTSAPYTYTVVDAACGNVSATVLVTTTAFPDPGGSGETVLCVTDGPVELITLLQGEPEALGTWTNPLGNVHSGTFFPGTDPAGAYRYTLEGNGVCPDSSAVVQVSVDALPNAGLNGSLLVCDTVLALDLFTGLNGSPQSGGTWSAGQSTPGLIDGFLNTTLLLPDLYTFTYTVGNAGCGNASAEVAVRVVGSVEVLDLLRTCNTQDRTYVVTFEIVGGDPPSYLVTGLDGQLSNGPSYRFTSVPLFDSESFEAFVTDQFACSAVRISGNSPCVFNEVVFVPQAFSPNGDNINDTFVIPGIEGYPNNSMLIFNRWGGKMFEGRGYDNRTIVWDGTAADGTYSGTAPAGTYYYVLDLDNGKEPLTGYIYLNR